MKSDEIDSSNELKELYSFNTDNFKQRFFELANSVFINHNTYMKEYNLLMIRSLYPQLPLPELPFSYSTDSSFDYDLSNSISDMLKLYLDDENSQKTGSISISKVLNLNFQFEVPSAFLQISPKIQLFKPEPSYLDNSSNQKLNNNIYTSPETSFSFINDFFCISTFPALFAHFSSGEYLRAGFNFLKRRITDPLTPQLVGVYLLHCSQFKDRFLSTFIDNLLYNLDQIKQNDVTPENIKQVTSTENLLETIYNSFGECISYFTEYHFQIVQLLRDNDEDSALLAVGDYFLREVLSLFKYSPLISELGILSKFRSPKNAESYTHILRADILDSIIDNMLIDQSFSLKILDLFRDMSYSYSEMPNISTIKYQDGFSFCMSIADMKIAHCIYLAEKAASLSGKGNIDQFKKITNIKDFISEMFIIKTKFRQYINPKIDEPARTETSPEMTEKKLKEQKMFHNFLFERSDGMNFLKTCSICALNNLKLKERQYASNLWKSQNINRYSLGLKGKVASSLSPSSSPIDFENELLTSFCFSIITGNLFFSPNYLALLESNHTTLQDLYPAIKSHILAEKSKKKTIRDITFDTATFFLDELMNFSNEGKTFMPELLEFSDFLLESIDRISFELFLLAVNESPFPFVKSQLPETPSGEKSIEITGINYDEFRERNLTQFISFNSSKPPPIPQGEPGNPQDYDVVYEMEINECAQTTIGGARIIKTLLSLSNSSMQTEFKSVIEKFDFGRKLNFFLTIQNLIEKSLEKSDFGELGPNYLKYYRQYIITEDYDFFLANLMKCINMFLVFFKENPNAFPSICHDVVPRLEYIQTVFNISPNFSNLVY